MTAEELRERLVSKYRLTFDCIQSGESIKIITPYVYPDGSRVEVFVTGPEGQETVTDFGCTLAWIKKYTGYAPDEDQDRRIDWVCKIEDIHRCGEKFQQLVWPHPHYGRIEISIDELARVASLVAYEMIYGPIKEEEEEDER